MIKIKNLTKKFGDNTAVDNISFSVKKGEVLGFLGPNGAGKTTTMKMVVGFLTPDSGNISVCGFDLKKEVVALKNSIGYLPERVPLYPEMTPRGLLNFIADLRAINKREERIEEVVKLSHIEDVLDQVFDTLSRGYKRRVALALALLPNPPVLILDEPTDGLDPNQKHEMHTLIKKISKEKAIIVSTHILEEVEKLCTRSIIISNGKIVADETPAALKKKSKDGTLETIFRDLTTPQKGGKK
ncbi:MAG: ABC transporter ATP-binding protein [Alphaproteobacteria bacterium]